jgi:hypothetical protein
MLAQVLRLLKHIYAVQVLTGENVTVGELERATKIPYSTIKRRLAQAEKSDLICYEVVSYKSTGKRVFWLSDKGMNFVECSKELFQ